MMCLAGELLREERVGELKRPSIDYDYGWDEAISPGETQRQKLYIKVKQLATVRRMVDERRRIEAI